WTCEETAPGVLDGLQDARSPQPILLLARRPSRTLERCLEDLPPAPLLVVTCGIQDPGNLGAVVRTAEAAGAAACFVAGDSVDPFHPRAVRATMGSIFRLPVIGVAPGRLLERLGEIGVRTVGASSSAELAYHAVDLRPATALFFGGEGAGLSADLLTRLDCAVRVPLRAGVDSLSVGAAAAVLLFEAARQRE
ncbi:MAG: TrmH family RNA methyltransferase, partial [Planctomycetota bacterium]